MKIAYSLLKLTSVLNKVAHNFLAKQYDMDLTPRKASIKLMIQEELTKLAAEADDEEEDDEEEDAEKDEARSTGQDVKA